MSGRAGRTHSGAKSKARGWVLKVGLLLLFIWGCVELAIHTGVEEFVKEKVQDWHDKMKVAVEYEIAQQMYVFDAFGNLKDSSLVSDLRVDFNKWQDSTCRPEWDNDDRVRFRKHCAGPIAAEIARFQQVLPLNDKRRRELKELLQQLRRIDGGGQPDSYFIEVRAKVTNNGKEIGTVAPDALLRKGSNDILPLKYVPSEERRQAEKDCQDLEALGTNSRSPCFKNDSVPAAVWIGKFASGLEKTEFFLTLNDSEGKKHEKHAEIRSFSQL
jgi:hypothetical protein